MTTTSSLGEGYDDAVRAVFRPGPNPSPSGKLRVANLYSGTGSIAQVAVEAGMEVTYAHDPGATKRTKDAFERKIGQVVNDAELPNFAEIPAFDLILAELSRDNAESVLSFVMRFLRVRRPDTFVLVGPVGDNDQALATIAREKVVGLGYEIASGSDMLLGIYEPKEKDEPVVVGLLYLDPIRVPVLSSDDPATDRRATMLKTVLERLVEAFPPPKSR